MTPNFAMVASVATLLVATGLVARPASAQTAAAQPAPAASAEDYLAPASMKDVTLSPDGRQIAMIVRPTGERSRLLVMDAETLKATVVAGFTDADVTAASWIGTARLQYTVAGRGLHAVDSDGRNRTGPGGNGLRLHGETTEYLLRTQQKFDHKGNYLRTDLWRIDLRTGSSRMLQAPGNTTQWLTDAAGEALAVLTWEEEGRRQLRYKDPKTAQWRVVLEFEAFGPQAVELMARGPAGTSTIYVLANNGSERRSVYVLDLDTGKLDPQPLLSVKGRDFIGRLFIEKEQLIGFSYLGDASTWEWLDPARRRTQEHVDRLLPGQINSVWVGSDNQTGKAIVQSFSDRVPKRYYLYDAKTDKLVLLGDAMRGIDPATQARVEVVRYRARDGLEIPARITLPASGAKNAPMVVLLHSPWNRSSGWGWEAEPQFLASRGYIVLQPDYRGIYGYGLAHYKGGWKQWGRAMQDDIADGVRWAVKEGYADASRVCIAGFAYGGYAALMGLARDGELYQCAVAVRAMTDLEEYVSNFFYFNEEYRIVGIARLIGDPDADREQLRATSPVRLAASIRKPVFMAYWDDDREVPFFHGSRMRDALRRAGTPVDWLEFDRTGGTKDRVEVLNRIEKFLATHLGKP